MIKGLRKEDFFALLPIVLVFLLIAAVSSANVFNMGAGLTSLEFVMVGNPGNEGELSDPAQIGIVEPVPSRVCGAVNYLYKIGKYEVTNSQYCEFLNAVASSDPYNLYDTNMGIPDEEGCGIIRSGNEGSFTYSVMEGRTNIPVKWVSFYDACRFVNWLHNGQGNGDTETGAYTITPQGISENTITRNPNWRFAVTSEDEWYKAAYHKNDGVTGNYWDYPTGSDTPPTAEAPPGTDSVNGSANWDGGWGPIEETNVGAYTAKPSSSPYGTFDQGGNAWEMLDSITVITGYGEQDGNYRGLRGGEASSNPGEDCDPKFSSLHANFRFLISGAEGHNDVGFRISARSSDTNDVDNDGDGHTENQGDCDDGDDMIYPGGPEICGDGIDQDCSGSDEACSDTDVIDVGDGDIVVSITGGNLTLSEANINIPDDLDFIYPPLNIEIANIAVGATIDVTIDLPAPAPAEAMVYKLINGIWQNIDAHCQFNQQRTSVAFQVTDNGWGDNNNTSGHISDPIGLATAVQTTPGGGGGGGGGGCFIVTSQKILDGTINWIYRWHDRVVGERMSNTIAQGN